MVDSVEIRLDQLTEAIKGLYAKSSMSQGEIYNALTSLSQRYENLNNVTSEKIAATIINEFRKTIESKQGQTNQLVKTLEGSLNRLINDNQNPKMAAEISRLLSDLTNIATRLNEQDVELQKIASALEEQKNDKTVIQISKLAENFATFSKGFENITVTLNKNFADFLSQLKQNSPKQDLALVRSDLDTISGNINSVISAISIIDSKYKDLTGLIDVIQHRENIFNDALREVKNLTNSMTALKDDIKSIDLRPEIEIMGTDVKDIKEMASNMTTLGDEIRNIDPRAALQKIEGDVRDIKNLNLSETIQNLKYDIRNINPEIQLQEISEDIKEIKTFSDSINALQYDIKSIDPKEKLQEISEEVKEVKTLNQTIENLKDNLTYIDPRPGFQAINADVRKQIETVKEEIQKIVDAVNNSDIRNDIINLHKNTEDTINNLQNLSVSFGSTNENIENLNSNIGNITDTINTTKSEVEGLNNNVQNLTQNIAASFMNAKAEIENLSTSQINTKDGINEIKGNVQNINGNMENIANSVSSTKENIENLTGNIGNLTGTVNFTRNKVENISDTLQDLMTSFDITKDEVENLNENIGNLNTSVSQIESLNSNLQNLSSSFSISKSEIENLNSNIGNITDTINTTKSEVEGLNNNVQNLTQNIAASFMNAKAEIENLSTSYIDAKDGINEIKGNVQSLNNNVQNLASTFTVSADGLQNLTENIQVLTSSQDSTKEKIEDLSTSFTTTKEEIGSLSNNIQGLNSEIKVVHNLLNEEILYKAHKNDDEFEKYSNAVKQEIKNLIIGLTSFKKDLNAINEGNIKILQEPIEKAMEDLKNQDLGKNIKELSDNLRDTTLEIQASIQNIQASLKDVNSISSLQILNKIATSVPEIADKLEIFRTHVVSENSNNLSQVRTAFNDTIATLQSNLKDTVDKIQDETKTINIETVDTLKVDLQKLSDHLFDNVEAINERIQKEFVNYKVDFQEFSLKQTDGLEKVTDKVNNLELGLENFSQDAIGKINDTISFNNAQTQDILNEIKSDILDGIVNVEKQSKNSISSFETKIDKLLDNYIGSDLDNIVEKKSLRETVVDIETKIDRTNLQQIHNAKELLEEIQSNASNLSMKIANMEENKNIPTIMAAISKISEKLQSIEDLNSELSESFDKTKSEIEQRLKDNIQKISTLVDKQKISIGTSENGIKVGNFDELSAKVQEYLSNFEYLKSNISQEIKENLEKDFQQISFSINQIKSQNENPNYSYTLEDIESDLAKIKLAIDKNAAFNEDFKAALGQTNKDVEIELGNMTGWFKDAVSKLDEVAERLDSIEQTGFEDIKTRMVQSEKSKKAVLEFNMKIENALKVMIKNAQNQDIKIEELTKKVELLSQAQSDNFNPNQFVDIFYENMSQTKMLANRIEIIENKMGNIQTTLEKLISYIEQ